MSEYKYLIVGGGMTADAAVRGIRERDQEGAIGLIGEESEGPYNRPPLTKGLWQGKPLSKVWRGTAGRRVDLFLGRRAVALDVQGRSVTDDQGTEYTYEKLLLATGGTPRRLRFGGDGVIYYRTIDDYRHLRALADRGSRFVVIGGGFIGSELAASLTSNGKQVTLVFPEECLGHKIFPHGLAQFLHDYYRQKGVSLLSGHTVEAVESHEHEVSVQTRPNGGGENQVVMADGAVAGLGIVPNVALAEAAGLPVDNGIVVDEGLHAGQPDIFAAGDVASFFNPALGRRIRVEHEDNANSMGLAAGHAMAGDAVNYDYLPYFYSDLFDLGYEAIGDLDARLETVEDWQEPYRKGVVYYLHEGRVRGVLLWNVWGQVDAARALIAQPGPFRAEDLKGYISRD